MNLDIEETVVNCDICNMYQRAHQREPMILHEIPDGRFLKIGLDIMSLHSKDYLIAVDYYSKYTEMLPLPDKTAKTVVEQVKSICVRHGIPGLIQSDGMPFLSKEFVEFTNTWGIKTSTSSSEYSQSNGQAERTIQTLKK